MLKLVAPLTSSFNLKLKEVDIDNIVFRLHYRATCWLLVIFTLLVTGTEFIGEKIKCTHSDPTDSRKQIDHVINTYCFFMSTFTIPRHHHNRTGDADDGAHPGVGPFAEGDSEFYHSYYQWVPYVTILQALSFYLPHYIWRQKERGQLKNVVNELNYKKLLSSVDRSKRVDAAQSNFEKKIKIYGWWLNWLIICEFLNAINLILQVYFTNLFLGGRFMDLGTMVYAHYDDTDFNPLDKAFPKMAKCTFQKYGPSGSLQTHDAICVLSLNIVNEKMYLVLWYWYILLAIPTFWMPIQRVLEIIFYKTELRFNTTLYSFGELTFRPKDDALEKIMTKYTYNQWFFLKHVATNVDSSVARGLFKRLAADKTKEYKTFERTAEEGESEKLLSNSFSEGSSTASDEYSKMDTMRITKE